MGGVCEVWCIECAMEDVGECVLVQVKWQWVQVKGPTVVHGAEW